MKAIILDKQAAEFSGKNGELVKGFTVKILRENDLEVKRYWLSPEKAKNTGLVDGMICNPFEEDEITIVNATFDEGRNGKIQPTKFTA